MRAQEHTLRKKRQRIRRVTRNAPLYRLNPLPVSLGRPNLEASHMLAKQER